MTKLEDELKEARNQAEEADKKYDEVAKKLAQVTQCCQLEAEIQAEKHKQVAPRKSSAAEFSTNLAKSAQKNSLFVTQKANFTETYSVQSTYCISVQLFSYFFVAAGIFFLNGHKTSIL
jgi:hypothetical protein